ncbi:MAG: NAD(P)/FAD-dependent oxidoreductase [Brevibacillus sp.]|nr:NAD(P)/FAD-dependent oxidoreductase [Brevibacillus sp.]
MKTAVVVGGGIAGLVSSILLSKSGVETVLIEKEKTCGGLLRSFRNNDGVFFDYGTHILSETMIKELDDILFERMNERGWEEFDILKPGNIICGKLYDKNQMIYTPYLPKEIYYQGLVELLHTKPFEKPVENLKEYTEKQFGKTFSQHVFAPLMKKLLGCKLEDLHQDAHLLFGYNRLVVADGHTSRELKKSPFFESKISFETFYEGVSPMKKYYPSDRGGVGKWPKQLQEQAEALGVKILTGQTVRKINVQGEQVTSVEIDNGDVLFCDQLIWTLSPYLLLKAANIAFDGKPPQFRTMTLHHFVFDRPFSVNNFFVYCNDANYLSFRITLYPNITNSDERKPPYNCTVEVLSDPVDNLERLNCAIHRELIDLKIIEEKANVLYRNTQKVEAGFPVYTNEFVKQNELQRKLVKENFSNVSLLGKGNGVSFFMNEVLVETYKEMKKLIETISHQYN